MGLPSSRGLATEHLSPPCPAMASRCLVCGFIVLHCYRRAVVDPPVLTGKGWKCRVYRPLEVIYWDLIRRVRLYVFRMHIFPRSLSTMLAAVTNLLRVRQRSPTTLFFEHPYRTPISISQPSSEYCVPLMTVAPSLLLGTDAPLKKSLAAITHSIRRRRVAELTCSYRAEHAVV
ncbi:hypothetical protein KC363_g238 [Hortaea werneckii]|nr:hypothetical protein KC363_g238 [Hortaea werneckii]